LKLNYGSDQSHFPIIKAQTALFKYQLELKFAARFRLERKSEFYVFDGTNVRLAA
jgi:hypothetical protein